MRLRNVSIFLLFTALLVGTAQPAKANAVEQLANLPAKTDWAIAATDYDAVLASVRPIYERMAATMPHLPSFDQAGQTLKGTVGINVLDSSALSEVGFDVQGGVVIHGAVSKRLKNKQGLTISVAATDSGQLARWIEQKLTSLLGATSHGSKRIRGTNIRLFGPAGSVEMGIASQGKWMHLFSGPGKKAVLSEANRMLKSRRPLRKTKAYTRLLDAGTDGNMAGFVNLTPVTKMNLARLKAEVKRVRSGPSEFRKQHLYWINERIESEKQMLRMQFLAARLSLQRGDVTGSAVLDVDKKTWRQYRKDLGLSVGPAFDMDALRKSGMGYLVANVLPSSVLSLLKQDAATSREWRDLSKLVQALLGVDMESDWLPQMTGPSLLVFRDIVGPAGKPAVAQDDSSKPAHPMLDDGEVILTRVQAAILSRVRSTAPFEKQLERISALIREGKGVDGITLKSDETTVDGIRYVSVHVPMDNHMMHLHLGVGKGTVLLGIGPDLPSVSRSWFESVPTQSAVLAEGYLDVSRMIQSIERSLREEVGLSPGVRQEWENTKAGLSMLLAGALSATVSESKQGFRLSTRVAIPQ